MKKVIRITGVLIIFLSIYNLIMALFYNTAVFGTSAQYFIRFVLTWLTIVLGFLCGAAALLGQKYPSFHIISAVLSAVLAGVSVCDIIDTYSWNCWLMLLLAAILILTRIFAKEQV